MGFDTRRKKTLPDTRSVRKGITMKNTARKLNGSAEEPIGTSRARLVRRGPKRQVSLTLRALREAAGLTQAQVAKTSGIVQPEISKLEAASTLDDRMVA